MNRIAAAQYLVVYRIVFECPEVVLVVVPSSNAHPHPFDLAIEAIGLFRREAKEEFHVRANRQIISDFFGGWVHVVAISRHPHDIFQVVAILFNRRKWIVLIPHPRNLHGSAGRTPTVW